MKIRFLVLPAMALAFVSSLAGAQTPEQLKFLQSLEGKTKNMQQCAAIATELEKMPVPANHEAAKEMAGAMKLAAGTKPVAAPAPIDPVHAQFAAKVGQADAQLAACGKQLYAGLDAIDANVKPFIEGLKKQSLKEDEKKKISQVLGAYMQAKQGLQTAIGLLSKDIEMQKYVSNTLRSVYLNQKP